MKGGKVHMLVKIAVVMPNSWADGCTLSQLKSQAASEARGRLAKVLKGESGVSISSVEVTRVCLGGDHG